MFKLGLIINPLAGLGGPLALKGSDALAALKPEALPDGQTLSRSEERCLRCLQQIAKETPAIEVYGFDGAMGGRACREAGLKFVSLGGVSDGNPSRSEDTVAAAKAAMQVPVDLILFVGGDGTARDIYRAVGSSVPALGLPAGVKMHSGVYAVSPEACAEIVCALVSGQLVDIAEEEVRDIDEEAFRSGKVSTRYYGSLTVPRLGGFLQRVKDSGREVEELVLAEIADEVIETMEDDCLYIVGPGSTTAGVMQALGLDYTLLGFDLVRGQQLLEADVDAAAIMRALDAHSGPVKVLITAIGGQGHLLGRGNQQLTPELIRRIGRERFQVLATKTKLTRLQGRPLLVDSNDPQLDREWQGFIPVTTGYRDQVLYKVGNE